LQAKHQTPNSKSQKGVKGVKRAARTFRLKLINDFVFMPDFKRISYTAVVSNQERNKLAMGRFLATNLHLHAFRFFGKSIGSDRS
jgi:hypothetical protein